MGESEGSVNTWSSAHCLVVQVRIDNPIACHSQLHTCGANDIIERVPALHILAVSAWNHKVNRGSLASEISKVRH